MAAVIQQIDAYLEQFEKLNGQLPSQPTWLRAAREQGMRRFAEAGFPTVKQEEYKYTNLDRIARGAFRPAVPDAAVDAGALETFAFRDLGGPLLVFVDGRFRENLSSLGELPAGLAVGSLRRGLASHAAIETHLARYSSARDNSLAALNSALWEDGAFVQIADRAVIEQPVHVLFVSSGEAETASQPRVLILAGLDSQASVVENYAGLSNTVTWTNAVTEIVAAANARLDHYRVQQEQPSALHTSHLEIRLGRSSNVTTHSLSLGAALARNDLAVVLEDEGGECTMNGLYAVNGEQHVDHHTFVDHTKPHCQSHQLYKGVLDGKARGVFSGKIIVRPDAQKTDAYQSNKNLLLSTGAEIDTKPQLQIDANDVKCSHGATVGQIDEESIFYLRSRGISHDEARDLLTYAFAADVLERIKITAIREHFEGALMNWLTAPHPVTAALEGRNRQ